MGIRTKLIPTTTMQHVSVEEAGVNIRTDGTQMEITGPCGAAHTLPLTEVADLIEAVQYAYAKQMEVNDLAAAYQAAHDEQGEPIR